MVNEGGRIIYSFSKMQLEQKMDGTIGHVLDFINPFTPKREQFHISHAASPEIQHHTRRTWLFMAYSDECMMLILLILTTSPIYLF